MADFFNGLLVVDGNTDQVQFVDVAIPEALLEGSNLEAAAGRVCQNLAPAPSDAVLAQLGQAGLDRSFGDQASAQLVRLVDLTRSGDFHGSDVGALAGGMAVCNLVITGRTGA